MAFAEILGKIEKPAQKLRRLSLGIRILISGGDLQGGNLVVNAIIDQA